MREWTSVEDGLPEPYKDCWITYEFASGSRNVTESYVNDKGRWNLAASKASRKVIACIGMVSLYLMEKIRMNLKKGELWQRNVCLQ